MALTLQRKLELAGDLSKVQPLLQRLHVLRKPKPKQRHLVRNVILVSTAIGVSAVVLGAVLRRRDSQNGTVDGDGGYVQADPSTHDDPDLESGFDAVARQPTTASSG